MTIRVDRDIASRTCLIRVDLSIVEELLEDNPRANRILATLGRNGGMVEELRLLADALDMIRSRYTAQRDPGDENDRAHVRLGVTADPEPERPNALRPNRKIDL